MIARAGADYSRLGHDADRIDLGLLLAEPQGMFGPQRRRTWAAALCGGIAISAACASQQARNQPPQQAQLASAVSTPNREEPPEYLSGTARAVLKARMASHTREMTDLVSAIMVLRYPTIAERADRIAGDASLSRPLTGDATELNSALPVRFFVHQDELRAEARALATAARALNPFHVADAYGRLSQACVRCHAVYRQGS